MRWSVAVMACVMAGVLAPSASAAPLPGSNTPLPGSTFQGGDGDQDDQGSSIDWQHLDAAGRVVGGLDDDDMAFAGGTREDVPGEWRLTSEGSGVNPAKDNILDAWSSVDQPAADTFAYLAFTREKANGDTYVAFELNRDARLWNNGHDRIPCRRTGDLLVAMFAHGNGIDLFLQRWITELTDAETGCATHGHLELLASVPDGSAQGDVNAGAIMSRLPGAFAPGQIPDAGLFGEAALNLSALFQAAFGDRCFTFSSVWMHSRSSDSEQSNMQDYVAPRALTVRSCTASGVKFFDLNADGRRDPGEPGIPRFLIWADYNGDGVRQSIEPYSVTDVQGRYVISDIKPPTGHYTLREKLLTDPASTAWLCSYPNAGTMGGFANGTGGLFGCGWGPIDATTSPRAPNRDFGNWVPARLTLRKRLWPAGDPGRFDLKVNGQTVLPGAGDGSTTTIALPPGTYDVSETAVPPADAAAYRSSVSCRRTPRRASSKRPGTSFAGLVLLPGSQATCTFRNLRPGTPAIAIEKTGPTVATAGDTLHYTLSVTNPGDVPIRASAVRVSDDTCDDPPALAGKADADGTDGSPGTLDPGDTWTYECSHVTSDASADCAVTVVKNIATADGSAGGTTVSDTSSVTTTLRCPDQPPEPPQPEPGPEPEPFPIPAPVPVPPAPVAPIAPPGPVPPTGGVAGAASFSGPRGCITRVSQLRLTGVRMDRVRVSVDGRLQSTRKLAILQERLTPLSRVFSPGRHVVTLRVAFQPGSDSAAVTLRRVVTVCPRRATLPRFTG